MCGCFDVRSQAKQYNPFQAVQEKKKKKKKKVKKKQGAWLNCLVMSIYQREILPSGAKWANFHSFDQIVSTGYHSLFEEAVVVSGGLKNWSLHFPDAHLHDCATETDGQGRGRTWCMQMKDRRGVLETTCTSFIASPIN